ncbi:type I restriction-modification system subunit M [Sansalvadorimonas sp. 2012CJ34-2]|uniref:site-specific DNA-methyltransferase (adenine-specific) n=1 Tax=Parendozoicomonas callyspongiae TaxID=2942213 RepID=A0ABT0PMC4_9GAMM|nr:class I SAM-dependent DNA methyltransferase [Sansalvadorimonas sp. 2012CJ34-2]MCL6272141.1 type I restriction-modification system subunit M [Sansalvadorimonas sp. 2012CJ34-2]
MSDTHNKLTLEALESWLWESANIMRGSIDSSDFKNYIFGLIFLKRFNDVFEEKVQSLMEDEECSREEAIELEHDEGDHFVPEHARWDYIIQRTENIGEAIDEAFADIEARNPYLEGVLTAIQFGDKAKLGDTLLARLLRHFNQYHLGNSSLYKADMLGDAYEYLIKKFADDAGKKGGEFYTPKPVVQLLVRLLDPQPGQSVYDPTFGCGGMLVESAHHVAELPGGTILGKANVTLYGQEKNLGTWAIGKLNLYLHNMSADLRRGDTLVSPLHLEGKAPAQTLKTFDRVIANPPFSAKQWWTPLEVNLKKKVDKNGKEKEVAPNYKKDLHDKHGRLAYGVPPRGYADLAFVQHMLASVKDNGRMAVVLPHGVLFRGGEEGKIRTGLLKGTSEIPGDRIEAVIGLPSALFYNTGIPACVLILNKQKPASLKNKVIFIDASREFAEGKNQNTLREQDIDHIHDAHSAAFINSAEEEKYSRVVELKEIADNDYNLNIARYIDTSEPEPLVDIPAVLGELDVISKQLDEVDTELNDYLNELGLTSLRHSSVKACSNTEVS